MNLHLKGHNPQQNENKFTFNETAEQKDKNKSY